MTKFDHSSNLPIIFRENELSILPVSRYSFLVGKFDLYTKLPDCTERPSYHEIPSNYVTLPASPAEITSEQTAIACAFASGIIHDFVGEEPSDMFLPTISGRFGSGVFDFNIRGLGQQRSYLLHIDKAQIEIDAVYESPRAIYIIEAKNHECRDFNTRQLYFPYRYISQKNNVKKAVIPLFLKYINGSFFLYRFNFLEEGNLNSIYCERATAYTICPLDITISDINSLLSIQPRANCSGITFPQADSFIRIEDMLQALYEKGEELTMDEIIAKNYDFTMRQADYYANAAAYLGLVSFQRKNGSKCVELTKKGKRIASLPFRENKLELARSILQDPVFFHAFRKYINNGCHASREDVIPVIAQHTSNLSEETIKRRAGTVMAWIKWIASLVN